MSDPDLLAQRLAWFLTGEARLIDLLASSPPLGAPSLLPGWNRAHVVAHLIGNADALGNLVHWARTREPTPMYADAGARSAQIARDADRPDGWLLAEVSAASRRLEQALASMTVADWVAPVRTALGREVSASEIPWMRLRESVVHALDLDLGAGFDWCPDGLVDALVVDVSTTVGAREGCPAVLLVPHDRDRTWRMGPETPALVASGSMVDLLTWVVGRTQHHVAVLPRWL